MSTDMMRAEIWLQETLGTQRGIEELASRMGYSSSQIRRRFRSCFGLSPGAYRDRLRLEWAARLLIHTPTEIRHVATVCGYRNHSAFSRAFQRHYGQTPRHYRQSHRLHLNRQRHGLVPFGYKVRQLPARQAVLTRLYATSRALDDLRLWQRHVRDAGILPAPLASATAIAILHDQPLASDLPRLDLGVQIPGDSGGSLALPPTFRLQQLPAHPYACLRLEHRDQLRPALLYMACQGIAPGGRPLSGEPPQLLKRHNSLELRVPLHH